MISSKINEHRTHVCSATLMRLYVSFFLIFTKVKKLPLPIKAKIKCIKMVSTRKFSSQKKTKPDGVTTTKFKTVICTHKIKKSRINLTFKIAFYIKY
jgi:hypothetical protein